MKSSLRYMLIIFVAGLAVSSCNKDGFFIEPEASPGAILRPQTPESSEMSTKVYDYTPAPGQFINETEITSAEAACEWAHERLKKNEIVSLGAFGGYIVVGFDHSIVSSCTGDYDFAVYGNSFKNSQGTDDGSNEPGIVYVMQDSNGNLKPDDTWYELKGSEWASPGTIREYSVTYYRPAAPGQAVKWTDSSGEEGEVDYLGRFHNQDYYYPSWVKESQYTLSGTRLAPNNFYDESTGTWVLTAYAEGYADNMGSDCTSDDNISQINHFRIADAVGPDGSRADLKFIDFIKVQTGVNSKSGWLGEVSTEVRGFRDL